ncbi:hypothetical protein JOQ06_003317, partial [Pogonophryne albipinna]
EGISVELEKQEEKWLSERSEGSARRNSVDSNPPEGMELSAAGGACGKKVRMFEAESDGGEVSGLSDVSWVCSASDGSSDSDPEPPRNVRPSHPDPPLADGPTVPAHAEVCATEPSPAQEIGKDGTVWTVMEPCGGAGRRQIQNILTESAGPTPHARHNITDKLTAFMCLCDNVMLEEILDCTIAEARRDRATWDVSIMELKAFIALLYVRGAYCGKNIEMESFWSEQWGNAFFNATLSRNRFREIMRLGAVQELHEPGEHTEKGLHAPAGTRAAR